MKVLDATFLVDYLSGVEATREYLQEHSDEVFIHPVPAYAEALVGVGNGPKDSNIDEVRESLSWGEVYSVDKQTAMTAAAIADEVGPEGPYLAGMDALIAAVGRELDAPVVTADSDLTHPTMAEVISVEEY